ncbi:MAG: phosphatase PAP2 family protein [Saprospiraceae bacterium]|nr:phosphatase PAP2 family protein [Saprospiraceae bacterium]
MRAWFCLFVILRILQPELLPGQNLDIRWLDRVNSPANPRWDKAWQGVSNSMAPVSLVTPLALFTVGKIQHDPALLSRSYEAGASFLLSTTLTMALKVSIRRPRPFVTYPDRITRKGHGGSFSFPSGHTAAAFSTATSLSLAYPKWYVIAPSYLYAGAVAWSRMYLGVHYPSDLLGGILVGVGSSLLAFQVGKWIRR